MEGSATGRYRRERDGLEKGEIGAIVFPFDREALALDRRIPKQSQPTYEGKENT